MEPERKTRKLVILKQINFNKDQKHLLRNNLHHAN